jgi:DNA-binding MarR family transcriptional regulator
MTKWLNDEEMRAWRSWVDVFTAVNTALETDLAAGHELTLGDYGVLATLSEAPSHALRMCDLAEQLHLTPSGITRRLDSMVRKGWVVRRPAPDDRRASMAVLTPAGRKALERAAPDHVESVRAHLLDHLSGAQLRNLRVALDAVAKGRAAAPGAER